jgi:hypothetical protein
MSEKVIRLLLDDIEDGEVEAADTIVFSYKGSGLRRIDLSAKNAARMDVDMQKWLEHSSPADGKAHTPKVKGVHMARSSGYNSEQLAAIREWGRRNGWPNISSKGKVAREVIDKFEKEAGAEAPDPQFSAAT